jgi:hypothetical protein
VKNSFYLVTPEQKNNEEWLASYEKEAINEWLSSLPITSPGFATQLFCNFVKQFNATEMPVQQRVETAELLRPYFLKLKQSLYPLLSRFGFPKGEGDQKIFSLLISLERNFTISYWLIVEELTYRGVNWLQGKTTALAIQRTIKGLSGIIVSYQMMYLPAPDWVWLDLHSLYKLSLKTKKESTKVPDETNASGKGLSPEESYIQILLFSLTQPNGLMQREIDQVYKLINSVSRLVKIVKKPVKDQEAQCVISIDEDRQPFLTASDSLRNVPTFFLNFSPLYKALNSPNKFSSLEQPRFEALGFAKKMSKKMPRELFEYTTNQWKYTPRSHRPLFTDRLDRHVTIGLTHTYLLQTLPEENASREVLAQSFSECELSTSRLNEGVLSVGSLVSYKKAESKEDSLHLGIVKKITIPKLRSDVIFELTLLSQQAHAVDYLNDDENSKNGPQKALFYRKKNKSKSKSYILIEFYTFDNGDTIRLFIDDKDLRVTLENKKCVGLGYWQFECRYVEKKKSYQKQSKTKLIFNYLFK